ncbi:MAG: CHASE domain-containing protein, partial [Candidatus Brocadiia bacterium]
MNTTSNRKERPPKYRRILSFIVLAALLSLTFYTWRAWSDTVAWKEQSRYSEYTDGIASAVTGRLNNYKMILQEGAALFALYGDVTRDSWKEYYEYRQVRALFPGIQGIGFSKVIQPTELEQHIKEIRAEGLPGYAVWPTGDRDVYTAIVVLEPLDERNRRAIGYDMFSEPVRRSAMERARDTGEVSISGKVRLVQESDKDAQAGFLMYVPIYARGMALKTTKDRRAALTGYVHSAFGMNDLMRGIFPDLLHKIEFQICDGSEISPAGMMYESDDQRSTSDTNGAPVFSSQKNLGLYGRQWTLAFETRPLFEAEVDELTPMGILIAGILISLLAFLFLRATESTRVRAAVLAEEMTSELRESEEKYRVLTDCLQVGVSMVGPNMEVLAANATQRKWFPGSDFTQNPPCYAAHNLPPLTEPCEDCPALKTFADGGMHTVEREAT